MHKEYYVLKMYMKLVLFSTIVIGAMTILNYKMYGEGVGLKLNLNRMGLFLILFFECLAILLSYPVFLKTKDTHTFIGDRYNRVKFSINKKAIHPFIFIILVVQIIFSVKTGNGVEGHKSTVSGTMVSYFFNILKISEFMPIYFIIARDKQKKIYWINIGVWLTYEILCGWTHPILKVVFLELFLRIKENRGSFVTTIRRIICGMNSTVTIVAVLFGAGIYRYMYSLKNLIRFGYSFMPLGFMEGLERLVSRFSSYPVTVVAVQNHKVIADLFNEQGLWYAESASLFRGLLPSAIMKNKSFRVMGNIVLQSIYPGLGNTTGSNYCVWVLWWNLLESDFFGFLLFLVVFILGIWVSKKIIYMFDDGSGRIEILYFFLLLNFFSGVSVGSFEEYIGLIYFIIVMLMFRIIKVKRLDKSVTELVYK